MRLGNDKKLLNRFLTSKFFLGMLVVVVLFVSFGYLRAYYQDYKIKEEISALEAEMDRLKTKKLESVDILNYVSSRDYVEEKARTELNMKKPGERVLVIERDENQYKDNKDEEENNVLVISNPQKWFNYFLHKPIDNNN